MEVELPDWTDIEIEALSLDDVRDVLPKMEHSDERD